MLWHSGGSAGAAQWIPIDVPIDRGNADFYPVQAITKDRAGRLWVSVVRGGILRLDDGKWTRLGDPSLSLAAARTDASGSAIRRTSFTYATGMPCASSRRARGSISATSSRSMPRAQDAWVGGELGLARFDGQRFHAVTQQRRHAVADRLPASLRRRRAICG